MANGDRWQRLALGLAHIKDGAGAIFALVLRRERTETGAEERAEEMVLAGRLHTITESPDFRVPSVVFTKR